MVDALHEVALEARDTVPGVDQASISMANGNRQFATLIGTSSTAYELDELQYQLNEGPCVDALLTKWHAITNDLTADLRWPQYAPAAAELGVQSQLAVRLTDQDHAVCLNLYSRTAEVFDVDAVHLANLSSAQAAHVLDRTITDRQLGNTLRTGEVIGHAVGIIMQRHQLGEHQARAYLTRTSRNNNTALSLVAEQIVHDIENRAQPPSTT